MKKNLSYAYWWVVSTAALYEMPSSLSGMTLFLATSCLQMLAVLTTKAMSAISSRRAGI